MTTTDPAGATTAAAPRPWGHEVRKLTERERLADPQGCAVEGCDEPGTHDASYYYRAAAAGRTWKRRERLCEVGAEERAREYGVPILEPARS